MEPDELGRRRLLRKFRQRTRPVVPPAPPPKFRPGDWQIVREDLRVVRGLIVEVAAEVAACPDHEVEAAYVQQLGEVCDRTLAAVAVKGGRDG